MNSCQPLSVRCKAFTLIEISLVCGIIPSSTGGTWTDGKDTIQGEYRGSTMIERFIDPNNADVPNDAADPDRIPGLQMLDKFYRWRVVENRQFAP